MSTELIINASLPETRIALMENGEIQDLLIERAQGKGITGNIYKGRVTRVLPGMQAAFVDIGLEKAAFLYVDDVFVHSEVFDEEEDEATAASESAKALSEVTGEETSGEAAGASAESTQESTSEAEEVRHEHDEHDEGQETDLDLDDGDDNDDIDDLEEDDEDESDDDQGPVGMSAEGGEGDGGGDSQSHPGTVAPSGGGSEGQSAGAPGAAGPEGGQRRRHRRGRRGGKFRSRRGRDERGEGGQGPNPVQAGQTPVQGESSNADIPANLAEHVSDSGEVSSDRAGLSAEAGFGGDSGNAAGGGERRPTVDRQAFRSQRSKDRRVPSRSSRRPVRAHVNIQDLLKEGQEVLVQVAKDPIATKGARLTCHISLPGRHLVCMPTIDHVGVSRRIERDDERRKLRDIVERNRPRNLGFIVRTASGRGQAETRIRQDIDYLSHLWNEIREKAAAVTAPALVYEDLNSTLRAIRDWVTEDIDKIIVDSRYHYNDIQRFVSHFMPSLKQKVELYHGDIPIFDAYNISTELSRALERKVWLKSGGYLVIDQAEALVAIDVNTGRYVGKKNLEDTILKTNLEAVQEIAYQLRLRNCGGIIILDLIDMEKEENKQRVYRALEEAIKRDRARPTIIKISELGLVEMTRKRTRDTIVRALCESCSHCEGKGFIKSKVTVAYEALREIEREVIERDVSKIMVQAHPEVIDILAIDERETLDQIERRYRKQIYLQAVTDFHPEQFEVAGDKKPGKTAGEFSEVVQPLRGASSHESSRGQGGTAERSERNERNNRGGRDRGRGRDRDRNRGRDRDRGGRDNNQQRQNVEGGGGNEGNYNDAGEGGDQQQPQIIARITPVIRENNPNAPVSVQVQAGSGGAEPNFNSDESFGNSGGNSGGNSPVIIKARPQGEPGNSLEGDAGVSGSAPRAGDDDFFENEEDRLAFLRAQAAQDAALARLNSGGQAAAGNQGQGRGPRGPGAPGGQGGGQPRGDRDRGGRGGRGGRGRRGGRGNGPRIGGGQNLQGAAPGGAPSRGPIPRTFGPSGGGEGGGNQGGGGVPSGGGDTGGGGSGEGGGGDHSSPPSTT